MVWCGVVWCGMVWCGVVWCDVVVWCGVVCRKAELEEPILLTGYGEGMGEGSITE